MNYTIAHLSTYDDEFTMSLDQSGNKYVVSIHDKGSGIYRSRTFDYIKEATEKFKVLAEWCCLGLYSFTDRENFLMQ